MKKKYKVKEKWTVLTWTYVEAESEEEAQKLLEDGKGYEGSDINDEWLNCEDTFWSTLQEV